MIHQWLKRMEWNVSSHKIYREKRCQFRKVLSDQQSYLFRSILIKLLRLCNCHIHFHLHNSWYSSFFSLFKDSNLAWFMESLWHSSRLDDYRASFLSSHGKKLLLQLLKWLFNMETISKWAHKRFLKSQVCTQKFKIYESLF